MKIVIYYYSKTGHTKAYADSLASRLDDVTIFPYQKMKAKVMQAYDIIMFMAPVHGNKIKHVDKFLKLYSKIKQKNLFIVAVGMQPANPERRRDLIIMNLLDEYHIRLYELMGGFDSTKLSFFMRKLMKFGLKAAMAKDPALSSQSDRINNLLQFPFEYNDINGIEKIVNKIHELERANKVI